MNGPIKSPMLVNAERMAEQHPGTYSTPARAKRAALRLRDCVKVCATFTKGPKLPADLPAGIRARFPDNQPTGERFWVTVTEILSPGAYVGAIDNDLVCTEGHGLKSGDRIAFSAENILDIDAPA